MPPRIDCHLDWLRYTVPWTEGLTELENITHARYPHELSEFTGETFDIGQGYNKSLRMRAGAILWNDKRIEQGMSVQYTGNDMQSFRALGVQEISILQFVAAINGRVSTLHACINIREAGAAVGSIITLHNSGTLITRARTVGVYSSQSKVSGNWAKADTFYVGSPKSQVQIRIYNKAAEQGVGGDWTRLEIVWRGRYAQAVHALMLKAGIDAVTRGAINKQITPDLTWWRLAMQGELAEPTALERKETERAKWLRLIVAPALKEEIEIQARKGSTELYDLFSDILENGIGPYKY